MDPPNLTSFFVYGTLKRGQCRDSCWPEAPTLITNAWVAGRLFGRSDYPAMIAGGDQIQGELWRFLPEQMDRVLNVLDQIEAAPDLYRRITINVFGPKNEPLGIAWTYHYAKDPIADGFLLLAPGNDGKVRWPQSIPNTASP